LSAIIKGNVFLNNGEYIYIATDHFKEFFNSTLSKWFICEVNGDIETAQRAFEADYNHFKEVKGISFIREFLEKSLVFQTAIFEVLFIESFILAGITQFVCILVSTLRMEREIGVMRSIGLTRKNVLGIFMAESIALGFSALVVGMINGLLGSILLTWYISLSIPIEIQFPLDQIALWTIFSMFVTLASTIIPSFRSSQKNIIAIISGRPMTKPYVENS
ncbi:MAG: FtsX-like permease family protein, partial [Candidatus Heimdallarchaeota archaeon]